MCIFCPVGLLTVARWNLLHQKPPWLLNIYMEDVDLSANIHQLVAQWHWNNVPCYYKQNLSTFTLKGNSNHFHYVPHFSVSLPHSQKLVTADKLVPSMGVHGDCANEQWCNLKEVSNATLYTSFWPFSPTSNHLPTSWRSRPVVAKRLLTSL